MRVWKFIGGSLIIFLLLVLLTLLSLGGWGYFKWRQFSQLTKLDYSQVKSLVLAFKQAEPQNSDNHTNFLVLGTDSLSTRGQALPLTDTMMLVSVDLKSGEINTLPLPRDLWDEIDQTKINALYAYGLTKYPTDPAKFPREVIEDLAQIKIHHSVVLSLDQIQKLIDLLGGIRVEVQQGFVDEEFPRPDVDVTKEHDPQKLYERVEFQAGEQMMSGERALKYIRSRHSTGEEGDDLARGKRQQQVIMALVKRLKEREVLFNLDKVAQLYNFYQAEFSSSLPLSEAVGILGRLARLNNWPINSHTLSIYPDDSQGVLFHPATWQTRSQWVYIIKNQTEFKNEVQTKLGLK